jgi:hypothetical protein
MMRKIVLLGTPLCALMGLVWAASALPETWLPSLLAIMVLFVILGVVPLLMVEGLVRLIARRHGQRVPVPAIWGPGLFYLPLAGLSGNILGSAYGVAARGESGSEYVSIVMGILWLYSFWVVAVVALIAGLLSLRRHSKPRLRR